MHQLKDVKIWLLKENQPLVMETELSQAVSLLNENKVPGIDGVPNEILK